MRRPNPRRRSYSVVADVIAFSEPIDTTCAGPEPNLVQVEFDDAAMAEAMEEMAEPDDDGEDW